MKRSKKETFKVIGKWEIIRKNNKTGEILDREVGENVITGKERVAKLLNGLSSTYFRAIAIGEGTTGALVTDTTLETERTREVATLSYVPDFKSRFIKTFTFASGVSYNITEAGVFDSDIVSGSTMLNRFTFDAKAVDVDIDLLVTITITFA